MNVLFLDVDGVLNSHEFALSGKWGSRANEQIDQKLMDRLIRIIDTLPDLEFVLSSTWRILPENEGEYALRQHGFKKSFVGHTPRLRDFDASRGDEIQAWLDEHPEVEKFVILDDDSDMKHLMDHLVQTVNGVGLQDEQVEEIIKRMS